jgi:hypothetical protein
LPNTLIEAQNFGKITVMSKENERVLGVQFIGPREEKPGDWSVSEKELKTISR